MGKPRDEQPSVLAPGKVFLAGEYSVLAGGPAVRTSEPGRGRELRVRPVIAAALPERVLEKTELGDVHLYGPINSQNDRSSGFAGVCSCLAI